MKLVCRSEIIEPDNIVSTSRTIRNIMSDCFDDIESEVPIPIPDEYYDALKDTKIGSLEFILTTVNLLKILKSIPDDHIGTYKVKFVINGATVYHGDIAHMNGDRAVQRINNIEAIVLKDINRLCALLRLYNFLDVESKCINLLAFIIGQILEESGIVINIIPELLTLIVSNYPSLYLNPNYQDVWLEPKLESDIACNPEKYHSVYYHRTYCEEIPMEHYKMAGNTLVCSYYFLIKHFEKLHDDNNGLFNKIIFTCTFIDNPVVNAYRDLMTGLNDIIHT